MYKNFENENYKFKKILARLTNMKYVFAGNYLEYRQFVSKQEENGYAEISKVEHLKRIKKGGTLIVVGHYKKRAIWPEIADAAKAGEITIEEQFI